MNEKTKSIIFIVIAVIGICIALAGIRMKVGDPQSSGTMITWIGVAMTMVAGLLLNTAKKSKN